MVASHRVFGLGAALSLGALLCGHSRSSGAIADGHDDKGRPSRGPMALGDRGAKGRRNQNVPIAAAPHRARQAVDEKGAEALERRTGFGRHPSATPNFKTYLWGGGGVSACIKKHHPWQEETTEGERQGREREIEKETET